MECFVGLAMEQRVIKFRTWAQRLKSRPAFEDCSDEELDWLWKSITENPRIGHSLGDRIECPADEWRRSEPVKVAGPGARFEIFLRASSWHESPMRGGSTEQIAGDATVILEKALFMAPGRGQRFACRDAAATLTLKPKQAGSKQQEADAMKVAEEDVQIEDGRISVKVRSLNHAYTKASLRLEPHRRNPGGRAYDHVAMVVPTGPHCIALERLRELAEEAATSGQSDITHLGLWR